MTEQNPKSISELVKDLDAALLKAVPDARANGKAEVHLSFSPRLESNVFVNFDNASRQVLGAFEHNHPDLKAPEVRQFTAHSVRIWIRPQKR